MEEEDGEKESSSVAEIDVHPDKDLVADREELEDDKGKKTRPVPPQKLGVRVIE